MAQRVRARHGHTPLSYCPEEEDDREALVGWASRLRCWAEVSGLLVSDR